MNDIETALKISNEMMNNRTKRFGSKKMVRDSSIIDTLPELKSRLANAKQQRERTESLHDRKTWEMQIEFLNMLIDDKKKSLGMVNTEDMFDE
jgi:hypothetical protein